MLVTTLAILGISLLLFMWDKIRADVVALLALLALYLSGVIDVRETLAGFSDSAVVMIGALFIVGEGLVRSGVTAWVSQRILHLAGKRPQRLLVVVMLGTALLSAFISNTGTVATLLPAVVAMAWSLRHLPSKYLIPLAFAANAGGLLTLTGTPPNIIVADSLRAIGLASFGFFDYGLIGVPLLLVTILYMYLAGQHWLPSHITREAPEQIHAAVRGMAEAFVLQGKLARLHVPTDSVLAGQTLEAAGLGRDHQVSVLHIGRAATQSWETWQREEVAIPQAHTRLLGGDTLLVKGSPAAIAQLAAAQGLVQDPVDVQQEDLTTLLVSPEIGIAEVLIAPRSAYIGLYVRESRFSQKYGVQVLSIRRGTRLLARKDTPLEAGDTLLVRGRWDDIELLRQESRNFVVVGEPDAMSQQLVSLNRRSLVATLALAAMVVLMVGGILPTVMAALLAAVVMLLGGCLTTNQAYRAINWPSVVLIAAMIPMSTALDRSGGTGLLAQALVDTLGGRSPYLLLAGTFLLTALLSQVISNTATAVLLSPVVLSTAIGMGLSPHPFIMMVAIGASAAFLTPIASTTNLMVMSPGGYTFRDYFKVGLPLVLLFFVVSLLLVPVIWPFAPAG
ncbi:MAG: SLC13 family permease [Bacteroidia bacterium]